MRERWSHSVVSPHLGTLACSASVARCILGLRLRLLRIPSWLNHMKLPTLVGFGLQKWQSRVVQPASLWCPPPSLPCSAPRPRSCALEAFLPLQPGPAQSSLPNLLEWPFSSCSIWCLKTRVLQSAGKALGWESGHLCTDCLPAHRPLCPQLTTYSHASKNRSAPATLYFKSCHDPSLAPSTCKVQTLQHGQKT